jgi:CubicO group peptidase (beta-lactamase class C family)
MPQNFKTELSNFKREYSIPSLSLSLVQYNDDLSKGKYVFSFKEGDISNDTPFFAQSVSKLHVKILILKLIESGAMNLKDKIFKWIDPVRNGKNIINFYDWNKWAEITIEDCLKHKSGIPDFLNEIPDFAYYNDNAPQNFNWVDILRALGKYPLHFNPGSDESYSNSNFYILLSIAELITKTKWNVLLKEEVLEPAGCSNSAAVDFQDYSMWNMIGYLYKDNTKEVVRADEWSNDFAKGLIYTSINDLHKFSRALLANKIIKRSTLYHFFDNKTNPVGGLGAGDTGTIVYYMFDFESKKSMVIVSNLFAEEIMDKIIELGDKALNM